MTDYFFDFYGIGNDCFKLIKQGGCFFIGASITAQKNGWADRLVELISKRVGCPFTVSKRVMGGVGLLFGVTNWPNLNIPVGGVVFIEFSTADLNLGLTPLDRLETLLEALIIDIINNKSFPIIIHNWRDDSRKEKGDIVRNIYNNVAIKFKIPVIRNDLFVEAEIDKSPDINKTWFRDVCHTTSEGAYAYAQHIFNVLSIISSENTSYSSGVKHLDKNIGVIEPIFHLERYFNSCQYAKSNYIYPITGQEFVYYDCEPAVEFEAIASGELMGIAFISGPTSGWVELLIDGEIQQKFGCFDQHSYYERFILLPAFYKLSNNLVKIRLSKDPVDFTIAKQEHNAFKDERRMQLVSIIGVELKFNLTGAMMINTKQSVSNAMQFEGMTSPQGLTLMDLFLQKVKSFYNAGLCIEFGTYKGRTAALVAQSLDQGQWLHAVDQAEYLEFERLLEISPLITWHKQRSETFCCESLPILAEKQNIIYTHHDASHFFDNVYTELISVSKYMAPYGVMVLDDFNDVFSQVRAAYYYLRYKMNFPYELILVGFNKAILVREELFDYWEGYILDNLLDNMAESNISCKLYRTDINKNSRAFYLTPRKNEEDSYYGLNSWGDRFYKRSSNVLK